MKRAVALLGLVALVVATLACGVRVAVEADSAARYGRWKTWAWLQRPPVARGDAELAAIDQRVRQAIEREMKARGYRLVERERPDFLVTYYAAVSQPIPLEALAYAAGSPGGASGAGVYEQGLLIVDVLDASSGRLAWRGAGRRVFDAKQTPQQRNDRIASAANAVVSEFASR